MIMASLGTRLIPPIRSSNLDCARCKTEHPQNIYPSYHLVVTSHLYELSNHSQCRFSSSTSSLSRFRKLPARSNQHFQRTDWWIRLGNIRRSKHHQHRQSADVSGCHCSGNPLKCHFTSGKASQTTSLNFCNRLVLILIVNK